MPIRIGTATLTYAPGGCVTAYDDGTSYGAHPHDTPDYDEITRRCGYWEAWPGLGPLLRAQARLRYCREHEASHHIVSEWIMGRSSQVLWPLAHGYDPDPADAVQEEALTMTFQRWLRANERPIIGGVDWNGLKARALALLDEV
jgi:hypothetical protein